MFHQKLGRSRFNSGGIGKSQDVDKGIPLMERLDDRVFAATTESIRAARRFVREGGEAITIDAQTLADIELATSELVSNAIEHGTGDEYQVVIATTGGRFIVEVTSGHSGTILSSPAEWTTSRPEMLSGRGLGLVIALSANAWVRHVDDNVIIGCEFNISGYGQDATVIG
jgi:anti-sigma regulatory factor (Ser/Thr protein kinase)